MKAAVVSALLFCTVGVGTLVAQDAVPPDPSGALKVWQAAPTKPPAIEPQTLSAARPTRNVTASDELRTLGDLKLLDAREDEAVLRVDGHEQTIRPGTALGSGVVRPGQVDAKKGETLIVVDFLGAGRSRVRTYAARDWTAQPPKPAE
jgi:hypothetical protein